MNTQKIEIVQGRARTGKNIVIAPDIRYYCGIGDGVHDGLYGYGATKEAAAYDFIQRLIDDVKFGIVEIK